MIMTKMLSRKFWVWIVWVLYAFVALVVTQVVDPNITSWFGAISALYIGGNVIQKYLPMKKE
jgi:hypothetical protein